MDLKFVTMYISATLIIGTSLAVSVAAILLRGYSHGWLLIPGALFAGFGFAIRKMHD